MRISFRIIYYCVLAISSTYATAQSTDKQIDDDQFDQLIRTAFAKIISPNNSSNLGSYAALDTKESELTFAGAIASRTSKRPYLIGIKFSGGSSDGVLPIFDDETFAKKVGAEFQYSFLTKRSKEYIIYDLAREEKQEDTLRKIQKKYEERLIEIELKKDSIDLQKEILKKSKEKFDLEDSIKDADKSIDKIDSLIKKLNTQLRTQSGRNKDEINYKIDSLKIKQSELRLSIPSNQISIRKAEKELERLKNKLNNLDPVWKQKFNALNDKLSADIKAKEDFKINGFKITWISLIAGFDSKTFRLFDSTKLVADQSLKDQFNERRSVSPRVGFSYSWYKKDKRIEFLTLSGTYTFLQDNSGDLTELTIKERTDYPTNAAARFSESSLNVLDNSNQSFDSNDFTEYDFFLDYYRFMFKDQGAIHININTHIDDESNMTLNPGAGIFYSFKKLKDDKGSLVNAELFFSFDDILNREKDESNVFERTGIGLRTSFPITFN